MYKFAHVHFCTYICDMFEYVENNTEWLFSGLGIALISIFITLIITVLLFKLWMKRIRFKIRINAQIESIEQKNKIR